MDSSIRSRQTGQVGNSIRAGVGGAIGFMLRDVVDNDEVGAAVLAELFSARGGEGVNGSLFMSGKDGSCPSSRRVLNSIDLTKTTWQFSGFKDCVSIPMESRLSQ